MLSGKEFNSPDLFCVKEIVELRRVRMRKLRMAIEYGP